MDAAAARHRADWLFGLLCVVFAGLGWRLYELQVVEHPTYATEQHDETWVKEEVSAPPGDILGRGGEKLATSKEVESVCLYPGQVKEPQKVASTLARILGVSAEVILADLADRREVAKGLTPRERASIIRLGSPWLTLQGDRLLCATREVPNRNTLAFDLVPLLHRSWEELHKALTPKHSFVWVKRRVTPTEAKEVREAVWETKDGKRVVKLAGVDFRQEWKRFYPYDDLAAHLIGLRDVDGRGEGGIEAGWDRWLRGKPGVRFDFHDARAQRIPTLGEQETPARPGCDVTTTIDTTIQFMAEQEMDEVVRQWSPRAATCIVMDPRTGEVLALCCRPTFNPNIAGDFPTDARRNSAITAPCEPGSTFKGIVISGAINERVVSLTDTFDGSGGSYTLPWGRTIHDHHPYGLLTVLEVIEKSSNICMAKIAMKMGATRLYKCVTAFGFGSPTGIGLPGESAGRLWRLSRWTPDSTPSIGFGHEVSVTPLQLATAYCAIANGGVLLKPQIVLGVTDPGGEAEESARTTPVRRVISEASASTVQDALLQVVEKGTGTRARIKGYSVAGKTGTAQKLIDARHYSHEKYVSSFLAFSPAKSARVLVLISVDEPKGEGILYGGTVAAPHVGALMEKVLHYLEVEPDRPEALDATPRTASEPQND